MVGRHHDDHQHQTDTDVDQLLAEVRRRVAAGQVVAVGGRRPDEQRPEHEQAEDRQHQDPVDARCPQAPRDPERGRRHGWLLPKRGFGGRIEPSGWKDGRASGATTPGISALFRCTVDPSTPYSDSQTLRTYGPEVPEPVPPWVTIISTT